MEDRLTYNIMTALLKSIYRQNLISEDAYNHSLDNLSRTLDCRQDDTAVKEGVSNGGVSN